MSSKALLMALGVAAVACASDALDASSSVDVPSGKDFAAVSLVLESNCGTLDCHGHPARNFRVYGKQGLRLFGDDTVGGADTRDDEVRATYQSVISIDPEALSRVRSQGGAGVEGWIVVAKARALQYHEGGVRLLAGSPGDTCLASWASGTLDSSSCFTDDFGPIPRAGESW